VRRNWNTDAKDADLSTWDIEFKVPRSECLQPGDSAEWESPIRQVSI
jgi:hypothetical protein